MWSLVPATLCNGVVALRRGLSDEGDGDEKHLHGLAVVGERHEEILGGQELLALADVGRVARKRPALQRHSAAVGPDAAGRPLVGNLAHPQAGVAAEHVLVPLGADQPVVERSEEHTSELQSLMRISYAVYCMKKKKLNYIPPSPTQ